MNTKLLKHVATDCAIIFPLIYFGAYEKHELAETAMQFVFWVVTVIAALMVLMSGAMKRDGYSNEKLFKKTDIHLAYANSSVLIEACALFTFGYPILSVAYLITGLLYIPTVQELAK